MDSGLCLKEDQCFSDISGRMNWKISTFVGIYLFCVFLLIMKIQNVHALRVAVIVGWLMLQSICDIPLA